MAIHAHSTPARALQPRLLRGGGAVPCRVLTSAEAVAEIETAGAVSVQSDPQSLALDDKCSEAGERDLLPAPLPSLTSAFAARRAIFGAHHG